MRIELTESFQKNLLALEEAERDAVFAAILALPRAIGSAHAHRGIGIRKLHASGIWEGRVGLGLRVVFGISADLLTLWRVGTHDEIQRYLRSLR